MTPPNDNRQHVRRVVLPSGKTIEVVYFDGAPAAGAPAVPAADPLDGAELHLCRGCATDLVYPTEWEEAGPDHWVVELRCPNCEQRRSGVFTQEAVERFDEQLDRGTESLVRDLRRLIHANMEDEIERFCRALQDDHILPFDF